MVTTLIRKLAIRYLLFLTVIMFIPMTVLAQDEEVYPIYKIQSGDFLSLVAIRFGTTVDDIIRVNNIPNADTISIGDNIKIPSLKGLSGTLLTDAVQIGDTLSTIAIRSGMNAEDILRINRITSRSEFFIGNTMILVQNEDGPRYAATTSVERGTTLLEKAVRENANPSVLRKVNQLRGSWDITNGQLLFNINENPEAASTRSVSPLIRLLELRDLPLVQGETYTLVVDQEVPLQLSGNLAGAPLRFFTDPEKPERQIAMIGIKADQETGLTNFNLTAQAENGETYQLDQKILVEPGLFTYEIVMGVDASTLEDHSNDLDKQILDALTDTMSERCWGTRMSYPVDEPFIVSGFGNRRQYNNTEYRNYHSGLDFGVWTADNINIYATADGKVIYTGDLPIHGLHTVIDHGWGVYSTYSHQSAVYVTIGQDVKRGDTIGLIGNTGRSAGPHLHWEIRINGVYVDPKTWLNKDFPQADK